MRTANLNGLKLKNLFKEKMKVIKDCDTASSGCWHDYVSGTYNAKFLNGTSITAGWWSVSSVYPALVLEDGAMLYFVFYDNNCNGDTYGVCALLHVDTNGFNPPNMYGKDLYTISIKKDVLWPYYNGSTCSGIGINCGAAYLLK